MVGRHVYLNCVCVCVYISTYVHTCMCVCLQVPEHRGQPQAVLCQLPACYCGL